MLSVITFPNDLFYPITDVETCGIIVKKGVSHPQKQNVLWLKIREDGYTKSKGRRIQSERIKNEFAETTELVRSFIKNPKMQIINKKEFQKACPIDFDDKNLELLPEVYLDEKKPSDLELKNRIDETIRDTISMMVKFNKIQDFQNEVVNNDKHLFSEPKSTENTNLKEVPITDLFETPIKTGEYHVSGILDEGKIPLVSCVSENGGFEGFFNVNNIRKNAITIASDGTPLTSFYHYYPFVAKDNVLICTPNKKFKFTTLLFITTQLNSLRWRFSYGRKCYENKAHKIKIYLPFNKEDKIDEDYIEGLFKSLDSWKILKKIFNGNGSKTK